MPTGRPSQRRQVRLRAVFDDRQAVPRGDRLERRHVGRLAVEVHRHDRAGARRDGGSTPRPDRASARSGSMSANTGVAPAIMIASAVYAADSGVVITSSPGPMPSARSAARSRRCRCRRRRRAPRRDAAANSVSNASTSGPRMNQPRSITRSIAASTSGRVLARLERP